MNTDAAMVYIFDGRIIKKFAKEKIHDKIFVIIT